MEQLLLLKVILNFIIFKYYGTAIVIINFIIFKYYGTAIVIISNIIFYHIEIL